MIEKKAEGAQASWQARMPRVAPLLVIVAGVCWGLIGLFSNGLAAHGINPIQITFIRNVLSAAILGCIVLIANRALFKIKLKDIWMFLGTGIVSIAFFNICYFACIQECNLSIAAILLYTAPCFVVVLSAILFKESLNARKIIALVLAFVGCLFVVGLVGGTMHLSFVGVLLGLGSGIGYALYSIFARVALARYAPWTVMFYTFLFAALVLAAFADPGALVMQARSQPSVALTMVALACISTLLPFACYTAGLMYMETGKASIMAFIEPLVATIIGVVVFHDNLTVLHVVGMILIIVAVALLNVKTDDDKSPEATSAH